MSPRRLIPPALLLLAVHAGCAARPAATESAPAVAVQAQKTAPAGDYAANARALEQTAAQMAPPQSYDYHLRAAETAADGGDFAYAGRILDALPVPTLDPELQLRVRLVRARAALARNDTAGALWILSPGYPQGSPLAERVLLLRGRTLFRLNDPVGATQALVQRERLLGTPAAVAENHDAIWSGLSAGPLDSALARAGNADPVTRGWVELANLARRNASLELYEGWRQRYPGHPGQDRLAGLMMPNAPPLAAPPAPANAQPSPAAPVAAAPGAAPATAFSTLPAKAGFYALLLPQGGGLSAIGEAIRTGFTAAAARAGGNADLRVYDAGNPAAAASAYNQAVSEGAGVVVGPLLRGDVNALSQGGGIRTPVLALNYLDSGRNGPPGFYQFGLAPEDEARAAAEDAVARGLRRALVLVPETERGSRVLAAFSQHLGELGGDTVATGRYSGEPKNWSAPVSSLLHYRPVEDRKKAAELRANAAPGVDPQRRNDFDFVFIDAGASQARILWPLFRYYHAERMPIYDTAAVNEGQGDADLAGIRFCDAPWMLDAGDTWNALRGAALSGRSPDLARFYVMGDDSYTLALRLSQNSLHPLDELPGASGTLRVGDDGAVHRGLVCAQTTEGRPRLLDAPGPAAQ
ncbi:MAG: penicillin-binding protein activator [Nevskia sp.]|nr:penicillin-binding protein activator [Nevskia sp.]